MAWKTLRLGNNAFVSPKLQALCADMVFCADTIDGRDVYHFFVEHQSSCDQHMSPRMNGYGGMFNAHRMAEVRKARRTRKAERTVQMQTLLAQGAPAMFGLLVYSGPTTRRWTAPLDYRQATKLRPANLVPALPLLPHWPITIDDAVSCTVDDLLARTEAAPMRVMLAAHKIARGNKNLGEDLQPLLPAIDEMLDGRNWEDDYESFLHYLVRSGSTPHNDIYDVLSQLGHKARSKMRTTADELRDEGAARERPKAEARGIRKGRVEGRAEGRVEGRAEERTEMLMTMLTEKFGPQPDTVVNKVRRASLEQARKWCRGIITAANVQQLLSL